MIDLLHGSALLVFAAIMGLGNSSCLLRRPSAFSLVAIGRILARTRVLMIAWTALAAAWLVLARHTGGREVAELVGMLLAAGFLALELWNHSGFLQQVEEATRGGLGDEPVARLDGQGCWTMQGLEPTEPPDLPVLALSIRAWILALLAALGVFAVAAWSVIASGQSLLSCALVLAFWVSIGTLATDLCLDVWPGFSTRERVRDGAIYYVQVFENWGNWGVVAGLLGVVVGAPLLWWRGEASAWVLGFPLWMGVCLVFASLVNQVLVRGGVLRHPLPLPMARNVYAADPPVWAWFFSVIHLVMAGTLAAGVVTLYAATR